MTRNRLLLWAFIAIAIAVVAVIIGAPPLPTILSIVAAVAAGVLLIWLPSKLRALAGIVLFVGGGIVAASISHEIVMFFGWASGIITGASAGALLRGGSGTPRNGANRMPIVTLLRNDNPGPAIENPPWSTAESQLRGLDGDQRWFAMLRRPSARLDVCCFGQGQYAVFVRNTPEHVKADVFQVVRVPAAEIDPRVTTSVSINRTPAEYPTARLVPLETVLPVARTFLESGEYRWKCTIPVGTILPAVSDA